MNDRDPLSNLLQTWRHTPPEAPDFNRGVWTRLQARPAADGRSLPGQLLRFPIANARRVMPVAAGFVLLLSLAAGSGAALAYASLTRNDRMATEYARSIDPLLMMAPHQSS